ncbi:MAG TPA: response regulator [Bryobacteraceae bacterium]|nr:response regulator [Bryobacteraceae bacterium]
MPPSREILIVEDNPGDVRLVREALRGLTPEITLRSAPDGEEALRILRRQGEHAEAPRPRLILLDFNLPKSDSREVLREIKNDVSLRAIPVAVLTTSDAEKDIQEAYDLHANCYLRKPVDLDGFLATIRATADFWLNVAQQGSE